MKAITYISIFLLTIVVKAQNSADLDKLLWERAQNCYSLFEDENEDGIPEYQKIDDASNGYLKISGDWPTCGCSCSSTIGAYKDDGGKYTLLQKEEFLCEWKKLVSSDKEMDEILPENFSIDFFSKEKISTKFKHAIFFLDVKIPRVGTDTEFKLELIPFGISVENNNSSIAYNYAQHDSTKEGWHSQAEFLYKIQFMAKKITDDKTLSFLLNKEYDRINEYDMECIKQEVLGTNSWGQFDSIDILTEKLQTIKTSYDIYSRLEFMSILMEWDRKKARFKVKSKSRLPEKISFKDFILKNVFWGPVC